VPAESEWISVSIFRVGPKTVVIDAMTSGRPSSVHTYTSP